MFWVLTNVLFAEPRASLFVEETGAFFLNVDLQQEWNQAELSFDQSLGLFSKKDIQQFSYEGTFDKIPSVLHMSVSLSKDQLGAYSSMPIPVIYMPLSHPDLSGTEELSLPGHTFQWGIYKNLYRPIQRWLTNE